MEEEERPTKLQKIEHNDKHAGPQHTSESDVPLLSGALTENIDEARTENATQLSLSAKNSEIQGNLAVQEGEQRTTDAVPLSKNQRKKQLKAQRWEEFKEERKIKRREKNLQRRERKKELKQGQDGQEGQEKVQKPRPILVPVTLVIDCGWDELMTDTERISLGSQVTRAYSDNSKAAYRSHLVISSFDKLLKHRFDTVLAKTHEKWKGIHFMQEDFVHGAELAKDWMKGPRGGQLKGPIAEKNKTPAEPENGEIIYLSSESPNTLTELKPYSTYIIGGLVDKNRHKGVCYKRAVELGIKTAKLPIGEYLRMASRPVLATNHVVEIMLKWLELGDWGEAFLKVIPQRKGGTLKVAKAEEETMEDTTTDAAANAATPADEDVIAEQEES